MNIIVQGKPSLTHTICFLFSGKAGVGKSYCSDRMRMLIDSLGLKTRKAPFAMGVKATAVFMGWDGKKDQRGRRLLQGIGQIGREYNGYMWANSSFTDTEEAVGYPYDVILVDDWRFENEVDYIKEHELLYKPITIRIVAPEREILRGLPEYNDVSETQLDSYEFDYTINNDSDGPDYVDEFIRNIFWETVKKFSSR